MRVHAIRHSPSCHNCCNLHCRVAALHTRSVRDCCRPAHAPPLSVQPCLLQVQMERSLFERLQQQGAPVKMLSVQYRMHPAIRQVGRACSCHCGTGAGVPVRCGRLRLLAGTLPWLLRMRRQLKFHRRTAAALQFPSAHFYSGRLRDAESITAMPPAPFYSHPLMKASWQMGRWLLACLNGCACVCCAASPTAQLSPPELWRAARQSTL